MRCPDCGGKLRVADILHNVEKNENYRRRLCTKCGYEVYTIEFDVEPDEQFKKDWNSCVLARSRHYYHSRTETLAFRNLAKEETPNG